MEANICINVKQNRCEGVQWIHMTQDRDECLVKTAIKLQFP
jgi:rRNA-processing protein FCF1